MTRLERWGLHAAFELGRYESHYGMLLHLPEETVTKRLYSQDLGRLLHHVSAWCSNSAVLFW